MDGIHSMPVPVLCVVPVDGRWSDDYRVANEVGRRPVFVDGMLSNICRFRSDEGERGIGRQASGWAGRRRRLCPSTKQRHQPTSEHDRPNSERELGIGRVLDHGGVKQKVVCEEL